jgi:hypothetical protein
MISHLGRIQGGGGARRIIGVMEKKSKFRKKGSVSWHSQN